jgi:hypothetical protein
MANDPLFWVVAIAVLIVVGILVYGIAGFAKGGEDSGKKANKVMQWRIGAQLIAVILILLFVFIRRMSGEG